MPRGRKPARVLFWNGKHHIFWTDYSVVPAVQRRVQCVCIGADTAEARAEMVKKYRAREVEAQHALLFGRNATAFNKPLRASVDEYLADIDQRVAARQRANGVRVGLAEASGRRIRDSVKLLQRWLDVRQFERLETGDLQARHLDDFRSWLAASKRSPHTVNLDLRNAKGCISWLARLRPERLRDPELLIRALKPIPAEAPEPDAYDSHEIQQFYAVARQRNPAVADLFRFIACTGCRRGEALSLTWADVDLDRGRITFRAQKTGRTRILPLIGAPEGDVAPGLLHWLRQAREKAQGELVFNRFPTGAWDNVMALSVRITPQGLRSNFTSYAASLGIPATVCALWQGHTAQVAERFYRAQILERKVSATIEGALGFEVPDTPYTAQYVATVV